VLLDIPDLLEFALGLWRGVLVRVPLAISSAWAKWFTNLDSSLSISLFQSADQFLPIPT
jgi:hypothetical protein